MEMAWVTSIVSLLLGGGTGAVVMSVLTGRSTARQIGATASALEARTPADVDSITVQGAEGAVQILLAANDRLVSEVSRKDAHIDRLEGMVSTLHAQLNEANDLGATLMRKLQDADRQYAVLQTEIQRHRDSVTE